MSPYHYFYSSRRIISEQLDESLPLFFLFLKEDPIRAAGGVLTIVFFIPQGGSHQSSWMSPYHCFFYSSRRILSEQLEESLPLFFLFLKEDPIRAAGGVLTIVFFIP